MPFDSRTTIIAGLGLALSSIATADQILLDFEQDEIAGSTITNYYSDLGISFAGVLFDSVDYGTYDAVDPVVRDIHSIWGGDIDVEAVAAGSGLASVTIGFEAVDAGLQNLSFMVARILTQDITVLARDAATGVISSHVFLGSNENSQSGRTVEQFEVDLDSLFSTNSVSGLWSEVAIHNHGGLFGIDDVSYLAMSVPVPGVTPILAGLLGIGAMRRRRR